jgi:hypothetical protein
MDLPESLEDIWKYLEDFRESLEEIWKYLEDFHESLEEIPGYPHGFLRHSPISANTRQSTCRTLQDYVNEEQECVALMMPARAPLVECPAWFPWPDHQGGRYTPYGRTQPPSGVSKPARSGRSRS